MIMNNCEQKCKYLLRCISIFYGICTFSICFSLTTEIHKQKKKAFIILKDEIKKGDIDNGRTAI